MPQPSDGTPYSTGYQLLPKERIGHCHCKDVVRKPDHGYDWAPVGGGMVDWVGQFQALQRDGFHYGLSLETHWRGAGTPEASTRVSMEGLRQDAGKGWNLLLMPMLQVERADDQAQQEEGNGYATRISRCNGSGAAGLAVATTAKSYGRILGSNDRLNFAVIGLNSRGYAHLVVA